MTVTEADRAPDLAKLIPDDAHGGKPCGRDARWPLSIPLAGWSDVVWRTRLELDEDNVVSLAAGVAFFGLFALVPAIGVVVSIYGLLADPQDVARHLSAFSSVIPAAGASLMREVLDDVVENSSSSLSFAAVLGIVVAIWSSSRAMRSLLRGLTIAYDENSRWGWIRESALSYVFTAVAVVVMALTIATVVVLPGALAFIGVAGSTGSAVTWLRWPLLASISCISLACLYRYGAARTPPKWRWTITGALVATLIWMVGSSVLSFYVRHVAHLETAYGPLGAFLVLMLWCFITAFAILLGAELNAELEYQTSIDTTVGRPLPIGKRGAFVADHVGPCRPPLDEVVRVQLDRAKSLTGPLSWPRRKPSPRDDDDAGS